MIDRPAQQVRRRASRLRPEKRRAQLLDCAIQVFAERGIAYARPAEVADLAGVSEATVFVYYPTRDALVQAVLEEVERFYMRNNHRFLEASTDAVPEAILGLGIAFSHSVDSHPHHARVWLDWSNSVGDAVFKRYLDYQERVVRMVTATLKRGRKEGSVASDVVPEDAGRILYAAAQMVVQLKLTGRPAAEVSRFLMSATRAVVGCAINTQHVPGQILEDLNPSAGAADGNDRLRIGTKRQNEIIET